MGYKVQHCGIVVLAAGQSRRLGNPKQLLSYKGTTLLRHTVHVAMDAGCGPVVVVVGARSEEVTDAVTGLDIHLGNNPDWEEGMASSLRAGLRAMLESHPETDGIIFMVCDQPFVTKSLLLCLMEMQAATGKAITASAYDGQTGTPALFHHSFFEKLMELNGDKGARKLIADYPDDVATVAFEEGGIDIDTKEDYERLLN